MKKAKRVRKMPRSKHFFFNKKAYMAALHKAITAATKKVAERLLEVTYEAAAGLPFKHNEVKLAGDKVTSDKKRMAAFLRTIVKEQVRWISASVVSTAVHAMGRDFANSHIGLYYEYGTGEKAVVDLPEPDPNPYRAGRAIVTRSKNRRNSIVEVHNKRTNVHTGGVWRDLGGNIRVTNSPRGGQRDEGFIEAVGEDVAALFWFNRSFELVRGELLGIYREAIASVHVGKFIHLSSKIEL